VPAVGWCESQGTVASARGERWEAPAPGSGSGVGGAKDPAPWHVPGAKAAGLTRRSPLKGLGFARFAPWPTGQASLIAKGTR